MHYRIVLLGSIVLALSTTPVAADEFDYEIGIDYSARRTDVAVFVPEFPANPPFPPIPAFNLDTREDVDTYAVSGTWYLGGVTSNDGPRTRAAFLAQASSVSFGYGNLDGSFRSQTDVPVFSPGSDRFSRSGDQYGAGARYVWENGWYVLGGVSYAEVEFSNLISDQYLTAYSAGVGKYLGYGTALDGRVVVDDGPGGDATNFELNLTHVGDLGGEWDYAADIRVATDDQGPNDGFYDIQLLAFPSRSFGFGAFVSDSFGSGQDSALDIVAGGGTTYGLLLEWFPTERIGLEASFSRTDIDDGPIIDDVVSSQADAEGFNLNALIRF